MGIASSLKKVANKTIMKFGGDITIRRTTETSYDITDGEIIKDNNENEFLKIINNFKNYNYTKSNAEENRGLIKNKFSTIEISKKYNEIYNNLKKDEK